MSDILEQEIERLTADREHANGEVKAYGNSIAEDIRNGRLGKELDEVRNGTFRKPEPKRKGFIGRLVDLLFRLF